MKATLGLLLSLLVSAMALAIPAHRMELREVVGEAEWIGVARLSGRQQVGCQHASGFKVELAPMRSVLGTVPTGSVRYWESWPESEPDGTVLAPIWTGSGLEWKAEMGKPWLVLGRGPTLLRIEPIERESEVRSLLPGLPQLSRPEPGGGWPGIDPNSAKGPRCRRTIRSSTG